MRLFKILLNQIIIKQLGISKLIVAIMIFLPKLQIYTTILIANQIRENLFYFVNKLISMFIKNKRCMHGMGIYPVTLNRKVLLIASLTSSQFGPISWTSTISAWRKKDKKSDKNSNDKQK